VIVLIYVVREQMCRGLHLQEYARGVFHDDDGTSTAWVKMDVPPSFTELKPIGKHCMVSLHPHRWMLSVP
jgi:hypothetical protein